MKNKKVVITGIGIASSVGIGTENFINSTKNGVTKITDKELNDVASEYFGANIIRRMDSLSKFGILASKFAYDDANLTELENAEIGGIFSTVWGPFNRTYDYYKGVLKKGAAGTSPLLFPSTVTNAVVGRIAKILGLKGVSSMLVGSCPINYAYNLIQQGKVDIALAGGIDDVTEHLPLHQKDGKEIQSIEGAFIVVIEDKESAQKRNAFIYAEIENSKTGNLLLQDFENKQEINKQVINRILVNTVNGNQPDTLYTSSIQETLLNGELKKIEEECLNTLNKKIIQTEDHINGKFALPYGGVSAINTIISCCLMQDKKPELNEIGIKNGMNKNAQVLLNSYFYKGGVSSILLSKANS